jgi:hypothetical protein
MVIQGSYEEFCTAETPLSAEYYQLKTSAKLIVVAISRATFTTEPPLEDWLKFQRLVEQWQAERGAMSSITEAVLCPAYQSIIGMGESALPFIFAQLKSEGDEPDQWFWALKAITGADPIRPEDRGNYPLMSAAWLEWAGDQAA